MEINSNSISDAWGESIVRLLKSENRVLTQRGTYALELENVLFVVNYPHTRIDFNSKYSLSSDFLGRYIETLDHSYNGVSIKNRLFQYGERHIDQIAQVVKILKADWYSRRATVCLWNVDIDQKSKHPPCLITLQFYIRDNKLNLTAILRSNDAWMAAFPDMLSCIHIQEMVAEKLGIRIGKYSHLSISYHLYEVDIVKAYDVFDSMLNAH